MTSEVFVINIDNDNLWQLFEFNGTPIYVNESLLAMWVVMGILMIFAVIVRIKLNSFKEVPTGFQNFIELLVETLMGIR